MAITVTKFKCERCTASGKIDNTGVYLCAIMEWQSDKPASYTLEYALNSSESWSVFSSGNASSYNGSYISSTAILQSDYDYKFRITITDGTDTSMYMGYVPKTFVLLDFNASGKGIAVGKISEKANALEIAMDAYDRHGTLYCNGLAYYESGGAIDPDYCLEETFLSNITGLGLCFVRQIFYSMKDIAANRVQIAYPYAYNSSGYMFGHMQSNYRRHHVSEIGWSDWYEEPVVTESGSSGIWTWKKYSDGTAECFGKINLSGIAVSATLGSWYRSETLYGINDNPYPVLFYDAPAVNMMFQTRNGNGALLWSFSSTAENAKTYLPQCYLIRPTTATNINGNINIIAKGKI